jgi:ABC-type glycerol-3-phosphate transport system substrate-binding protein
MTTEKQNALKKTLTTLEKFGPYHPLLEGYEERDWFGTRNDVLENKAVFTAAGASWMYSHWRGIDKEKTLNMVPVEMPVYQPVDHYIGGYNPMFAVMKNSPVRAEAVSFLMEFSKPNTAEKWVRYSKGPSGIKGNLSDSGDSSEGADQFDKFISHITQEYGGNVYDTKTVDYILGRKYKDLSPAFYRHLVSVMNGDLSADEAYEYIMQDVAAFDESIQ